MSQLHPTNFASSTQSIYIEDKDAANNSSSQKKSPTISFRPIIPKVLTKNVLSATNENLQSMSHSSTNFILSNSDQQDFSASHNHLASTYRTLS